MKLVVIPVYNEIETLARVLEKIRQYHAGDILAIDDGSTDGSYEALLDFDRVKVVRRDKNLGYGQSIIDGLRYAVEKGYEQVITIDCDEQHEPCMIPKMFANLGDSDVLSGSRYLNETKEDDTAPPDRCAINRRITKIINGMTGYGLTDSFCGFKLYRVSALTKLALNEPGYAMPLQFWVQAKYFGLTVKEIAVPRIYKNLNRSFGSELDDPVSRFEYYKRIIERELKRWSMPLSSELIRTT